MKGIGTLYGILITALFTAFAVAISVSCLARADASSRTAYAQDVALCEAQDAAELAAAYAGDMARVEDTFGGTVTDGVLYVEYDRDMRRIHGGTASYVLELGPVTGDGLMRLCTVRVTSVKDGTEIFQATATWQHDHGEEAAAR